MIVDSSALVAVLRSEPDRARLLEAMAGAEHLMISAGTLLEVSIVVDRLGDPTLSRRLDDLLEAVDVTVEPWTGSQARIARAAYRDYGKGSGHPAGLNFGDCFAYALASERSEALLYVGDDFTHTDLRSALA